MLKQLWLDRGDAVKVSKLSEGIELAVVGISVLREYSGDADKFAGAVKGIGVDGKSNMDFVNGRSYADIENMLQQAGKALKAVNKMEAGEVKTRHLNRVMAILSYVGGMARNIAQTLKDKRAGEENEEIADLDSFLDQHFSAMPDYDDDDDDDEVKPSRGVTRAQLDAKREQIASGSDDIDKWFDEDEEVTTRERRAARDRKRRGLARKVGEENEERQSIGSYNHRKWLPDGEWDKETSDPQLSHNWNDELGDEDILDNGRRVRSLDDIDDDEPDWDNKYALSDEDEEVTARERRAARDRKRRGLARKVGEENEEFVDDNESFDDQGDECQCDELDLDDAIATAADELGIDDDEFNRILDYIEAHKDQLLASEDNDLSQVGNGYSISGGGLMNISQQAKRYHENEEVTTRERRAARDRKRKGLARKVIQPQMESFKHFLQRKYKV